MSDLLLTLGSLRLRGRAIDFKLILALGIAQFTCIPAAPAQTPPFNWARRGSGTSGDHVKAAAADQGGNIMVAGDILSPAVTLEGQALTNGAPPLNSGGGFLQPRSAVYFGKFDPLGNLLWIRQAGNQDGGRSQGCAADFAGDLLVTGGFTTTNFTLGASVFTNSGVENIFVAKYDSSGGLLWARQAGGSGDDLGNSIAVDGDGNVFVGGNLGSTNALFGDLPLTNSQPGAGQFDAFLAKYSFTGVLLWVRQIKRASEFANLGIAADATGDCWVTGNFQTVADFGTTTLTNVTGSPSLTFVARYDASGNVVWARAAGAGADEFAASIALDPTGNACVAGWYRSSPTIAFGAATLTNNGYGSLFIIQYDPAGNLAWAKGVVGSKTGGFDSASAVTADAAGNLFVTGGIGSTNADFGGHALFNLNYSIGFVAKYDRFGDNIWVKSIVGQSQYSGIMPQAIVSDRWGNICVGGSLDYGGVSFDNILFASTGEDLFLAKINGPPLSLALTDNQAVLSWPTNATGLGLEGASDLILPAWLPVTNVPAIVGDQNTVSLGAPGNSQFFRLHNQ